MIEIKITPEMLTAATRKAEELGKLRNSITKGEGNIAGFLGEQVVEKALGYKISNTRDYDVILPDGKTGDVKTKRCAFKPKPEFECSIAKYNTKQDCDVYVFVRVQNDYSKAWILGQMNKEEYFEKARLIRQGQYDPTNKWRCKADCYNLRIDELNEVTRFDSDTVSA